MKHEGLLALFRNRPSLAPELLQGALGFALPTWTEAHGHNEELGPALIEAVMSSARGLDNERFSFYFDLAISSLGEAARRALEAKMQSGSYQYQSEFVRKFIAQGRQEGLEEGREAGRQEGLEAGQQKGRLEGGLMALFKVLDARGLEVDDASRQRLLACTDLAQLEDWLREAVTVHSVQELFEHKRSSKRTAGTHGRHVKARKPRSKR